MIAVILAQIASRWGQAVTLLALSLTVVVTAVSVPAQADAVNRASIRQELAASDGTELVVSLPPARTEGSGSPADATEPTNDLSELAEARAELSGFVPVTTVGIHVRGLEDDRGAEENQGPSDPHRLLARDGFCSRVTFADGRCPVGSREVALPGVLAGEYGVGVGEEVVLGPMRPLGMGWEPDGPQVSLTVVGVFEPDDVSDPYWAAQDPLGREFFFTPAIMTNRTALETLAHSVSTTYLDAILPRHRLTAERIDEFRQQLTAAGQHDIVGGGATTSLPGMLDRIEGHGEHARALLPIAATPMVVLGWFVVYLAVGQGLSGRRHELGLVALRGAKGRTRAMVVATESLLPILISIPVGLLAARLLATVAGLSDGGMFTVDGAQLLAAGLAAAGAVVAALIALRRELSAPIVQLLREVPPRRRRVAVAAVEVLAVALAVAVLADLWAFGGELVGVMVAAPVIVMIAVAVVAARAARPMISLTGRWCLRRGRLGPAMAGLYLARRPGVVHLMVVLTLVLGTLGFAATSTDVAAQGRDAEAERLLGAPRVLDVQGVKRSELLHAVRAADPSGQYAMAAVAAPRSPDNPPVLAVDSTRFDQVALWSEQYSELEPAHVARLLRPPTAEPAVVSDGELAMDLSLATYMREMLTVSVLLASPAGDPATARFGPIVHGQGTYRAEVNGCPEGCRLTGLIVSADGTAGIGGVTLRGLRQEGKRVLPRERLTAPGWWRSPQEGSAGDELRAQATGEGLLLTMPRPQSADGYVLAVDGPYPLPVVTAGEHAAELLTNLDEELVRFDPQASLDGLPGVGSTGMLMDLEYAERLTAEPGAAASPQVWLAEDTPDNIVERLRDQGLVIAEDRSVDDLQASAEVTSAAIALRFSWLTVAMAVLVGLGALLMVLAVDRRTWSRGLAALRTQGLSRRTATGAAVWSYCGIVAAGVAAGLVAGAAAWVAAGARLTLGVDNSLLPDWPRWAPVLIPWMLVIVVLLTAAVGGALMVSRSVTTTQTRSPNNVPVTQGTLEVGN